MSAAEQLAPLPRRWRNWIGCPTTERYAEGITKTLSPDMWPEIEVRMDAAFTRGVALGHNVETQRALYLADVAWRGWVPLILSLESEESRVLIENHVEQYLERNKLKKPEFIGTKRDAISAAAHLSVMMGALGAFAVSPARCRRRLERVSDAIYACRHTWPALTGEKVAALAIDIGIEETRGVGLIFELLEMRGLS